jgi:hypothetical protein
MWLSTSQVKRNNLAHKDISIYKKNQETRYSRSGWSGSRRNPHMHYVIIGKKETYWEK